MPNIMQKSFERRNKDSTALFPARWTALKLVVNGVILQAMQEFSDVLCAHFLLSASFDYQLWSTVFSLFVSFLTQSCLQLETFTEAKRCAILEKYRDMREIAGFQVVSLWKNLGDKQICFIPSLVGPVLETSLLPQEGLRKTTLPIFVDMMRVEHEASNCFRQLENEFIDKLDILVAGGRGDSSYQELFNKVMINSIEEVCPTWLDQGKYFVLHMTDLLGHLLEYRDVINEEDVKYKAMQCILNLLKFYRKEINREEIFCRYVYKLHDLLVSDGYWTEAGSTLKLHAELIGWNRKTVPADWVYPVQKEWQRKVSIYYYILDCYDKGKTWEKGIPLCKELAEFYENQLFDYGKLSRILMQEASFFNRILSDVQRLCPSYFLVGYFGSRFPTFIRNKVFVYRGEEYEKIEAFSQRLRSEWPQAVLLPNHIIPHLEMQKNPDSMFMQICGVRAIPSRLIDRHELPDVIKQYYMLNEVCEFQFTRPIGSSQDKQNTTLPGLAADDFRNLWSERTTVRTASSLPDIVCWSEVISQEAETISPVQNACINVQEKNEELQALVYKYTDEWQKYLKETRGKPNSQPLIMVLKGIIEAAVNGGLARYQVAFFDKTFSSQNADQDKYVNELRRLIKEQLNLLDRGLYVEEQLVPTDSRPLLDHLTKEFQKMRKAFTCLDSPRLHQRSSAGKLSLPATPDCFGQHDSKSSRSLPYRHSSTVLQDPHPSKKTGLSEPSSGHSSGLYSQQMELSQDGSYLESTCGSPRGGGISSMMSVGSQGSSSGFGTPPLTRRRKSRPNSAHYECVIDEDFEPESYQSTLSSHDLRHFKLQLPLNPPDTMPISRRPSGRLPGVLLKLWNQDHSNSSREWSPKKPKYRIRSVKGGVSSRSEGFGNRFQRRSHSPKSFQRILTTSVMKGRKKLSSVSLSTSKSVADGVKAREPLLSAMSLSVSHTQRSLSLDTDPAESPSTDTSPSVLFPSSCASAPETASLLTTNITQQSHSLGRKKTLSRTSYSQKWHI